MSDAPPTNGGDALAAPRDDLPVVPLGRTGLHVTRLGYGAVKVGRNQQVKYPAGFDLPDEAAATRLLNQVLDLGIRYIDTAPAYGLSEARIGAAIAHRRHEFVLSSKVGERFDEGVSRSDFSAAGMRRSVTRSLQRLKTEALDLLLLHSDGRDVTILEQTDAVPTLLELKRRGLTRAVGLSGKTVAGARASLAWADAIMVPYHAEDASHSEVMREAAAAGVGVLVKKGLSSGWLPPQRAIPFVLSHPAVSSLVVGGLNIEHLRQNVALATN